MANISAHLGTRIRELRRGKGLTLKAVADHAGVTPSLVSQLERGKANPSLSVLSLIANCLKVSVASLLESNENGNNGSPVLRKEKRKTLITEGNARFQLLSKHYDLECEFVVNEWGPGASTGKEKVRHEGVECGLVIQGKLNLELGQECYTLGPGDSITYPSTTPHRLSNPGPRTTVAVWVNSIPWLFINK
jgi:transcriptional regulator with XRE-family HTH domain